MSKLRTLPLSLTLFSAFWLYLDVASANENVVGRPRPGVALSEQDTSGAQVRARTLTDPSKLSEKIRAIMGVRIIQLQPPPTQPPVAAPFALPLQPFNGQSHPFTTKNASADGGIEPVNKYPWRAVGKMFMKFGPTTFVCTGSVIGRNLLVTAAHCVHNFGGKEAGFANSVTFEPARHGSGAAAKPFGRGPRRNGGFRKLILTAQTYVRSLPLASFARTMWPLWF